MSRVFMGIDIGTSGVRAALFDTVGTQLGLCHKEYPLIAEEPGMAELDPEGVFHAMISVVRGCMEQGKADAGSIEAIGMSTQLHTFLAVDAEGKPLSNVLTWADTRPMRQAERINREFDTADLYRRTGCRTQHPMYPLSKILWFRETKPELFGKTARFITIKEYILFKLFGEYVIDITDASTTACFNIHTFQWDEYILNNVLHCREEQFGTPVDCTHILRDMKKEYAEAMGLHEDTPIVVGSGDGMLANVGCGVFDDTSMSSTIGTSGALRIASGKPILDERQRTWCYCFTKDTWVAGGAINNGGIVLKWLRDSFQAQFEQDRLEKGYHSVYGLFDAYAEEIPAGSDGLLFLPLLTGERSPNWNAGARGTLHGLQLIHGRKHFVRAAMEGVMFRMFSVFEVIGQITSNVRQVKANGGYVNSRVWLQMQADIFNKEIAIAGVGEAAAFGAAYTAMVAVGAVGSLREPLPCMEPQEIIQPDSSRNEIYKEAYNRFTELYRQINGK